MMKSRGIKGIAFLLSCCLSLSLFGGVSVTAEETVTYIENSVIVVLNKSADGQMVGCVNKKWSVDQFPNVAVESITDLTEMDEVYVELLSKPYYANFYQILEFKLSDNGSQTVEEAITVLSEDKRVLSATPNYEYDYHWSPNDALYNDVQTNVKATYDLLDAESAWDLTTGSKDVTVGVIDSGVYPHEDLGANLSQGRDFAHDTTETEDDTVGHGTAMAGIIGAVGNNDAGTVGVNSAVSIVPLQVAEGRAPITSATAIKAVMYAWDNKLDILNCSFGVTEKDTALYYAMNVYEGLIVCSAGNTGGQVCYPAAFDLPNIVSVAATTLTDTLSEYSAFDAVTVDLAAPGDFMALTADGEYAAMSGTSVAAAFVSGAAAMLLSYNPYLTIEELKQILMSSVDQTEALQGHVACGGRLNLYNALMYTQRGDRVRNVVAKVSMETQEPLMQLRLKVTYNHDVLTLYNIEFGESLAPRAICDYSIDGELYINIYLEGMTLPRDVVRCCFISRQNVALTDSDFTYEVLMAETVSGEEATTATTLQHALLGDVNNDNTVNMMDCNYAYHAVAGAVMASEQELFAADVNRDGATNMMDVLEQFYYVSDGLSSFF